MREEEGGCWTPCEAPQSNRSLPSSSAVCCQDPRCQLRRRRAVGGNCGVHLCLLTCGVRFAHLSPPVVVSVICLYLVDVVSCVCMRRVTSVHAACVQVDGIEAAVAYFPCGFISSAVGPRFLMVFHLNTVGLVPAAAPVTSLFSSLLPSSALSHHTWGLRGTDSARCVLNTNRDSPSHTQRASSTQLHICYCGKRMFFIPNTRFTLFSVLYWIFEQAQHQRKCPVSALSIPSPISHHTVIAFVTQLFHFDTKYHCLRKCASSAPSKVYVGVCGFLENVKILFVFHFSLFPRSCLDIHIGVRQQGLASQNISLPACLSFHPSVHLCDCPACLSDYLLYHFFPLLFS